MDFTYETFTNIAARVGFWLGIAEGFFLIRDSARKFFNLHIEKSHGYLIDAEDGREDFLYSMKINLTIINRSEHPVEILDILLLSPQNDPEPCMKNKFASLAKSNRYPADHKVNTVTKVIQLPRKIEPFSSVSGMVMFAYAGMHEDYMDKKMHTRKLKVVTTRRNKTVRIKVPFPFKSRKQEQNH